MRTRARLLPLLILAAATLVFIACGGDDSKAEEKTRDGQASTPAAAATSAPSGSTSGAARASSSPSSGSGQTLQLNCDVSAFRFNGKLSLDGPDSSSNSSSGDLNSLLASLLQDVTVSGAYVAPDRTQFKAEGGRNSLIGNIEVIQIGNTVYTQIGSTGWQQSTGEGNPLEFIQDFAPQQLCSGLAGRLPADVPTQKERINGVDTTRYEYDRAALERLNSDLLDEEDDPIPDNVKLTIWVADKEKFPVKITLTGTGQQSGQPAGLNLELNVTDLNGNVQINAPR